MHTDSGLELFEEGLTSYMKAMLAVKEFQREVHKRSGPLSEHISTS